MSFFRRLPCSAAAAGLIAAVALPLIGRSTGLSDLSGILLLSPAAVWRGEVWRLLTAPLLANGLLDLFFSSFSIFWVSSELERFWRPLEWLLYGALCVVLSGLVASAFYPRAEFIPVGPSLWLVALLVARVRLAPHERIHLTPTFSISAAVAAMLWAAMIVISALASGLPLSGLIALAASAAAGWIYLSVRWFVIQRKPARAVANNRFGRLEL